MNNILAVLKAGERFQEPGAHGVVNCVNGPKHPESHGQQRAAFRAILILAENAEKLALGSPPVVDVERVIDENQGVSQLEALLNGFSWSPAVDNPFLLRQNMLVFFPKLLLRGPLPARLPLN